MLPFRRNAQKYVSRYGFAIAAFVIQLT